MYAATWQMPQICVCARVHFHEKFYCFNCAIIFAAAACKDWYQSIYIQLWSFTPFLILWKVSTIQIGERFILCKNEYSNSLTRPELLPVAVFYGKTQLENVQTPPDRRPGGPQRWRRRRPYTACTTMWGESITPFAQRVVHAQHANCCLLACLAGRAK